VVLHPDLLHQQLVLLYKHLQHLKRGQFLLAYHQLIMLLPLVEVLEVGDHLVLVPTVVVEVLEVFKQEQYR
jgi:hypothetical protein